MDEIFFSFLIPTRKRPEQCILSINEIINKSKSKNSYEFLFAFDDDDETSETILSFLKDNNIVHNYIVTERYGYKNLHKYYNKLCKLTRGKFMWCWNDDAYILTQDWDEIIFKQISVNNLLLYYFNCNDPYAFVAPLISSKLIDYFGYISLNTHFDSWYEDLTKNLITYEKINVDIFHNTLNNNIMNIDYTEVQNDRNISSPEFFSQEIQNLINIDREKLKIFVKAFHTKHDKNVFVTFINISNTGYYIKNKNTGLGNMLFQISSGLSYSIKNNAKLNIMDIQHYLSAEDIDIKNHILRKIDDSPDYQNYELVKNSKVTSSDNEENIFKYDFYDNINFNNYYENYNNFEEIKDLIVYCFSPSNKDVEYILNKYPIIKNNNLCSLHIRFGPDYETIFGINSEFIKNLENNYIKCVDHMILHKNISNFFIFTNDKEYSTNLFNDPKYQNINFYYSNERDYIDIWMISLIKNNIVSVSTLSWWGSYLNKNEDKCIICCKGNRDFLHYPGWVVL